MSGAKGDPMAKSKIHREDELILEANRINYSLRSTFFYRTMNDRGYFEIVRNINRLVSESSLYSWEDRKYWNITHNAWDLAKSQGISPIAVFAHPKILVEHPALIAYYRNVAALPLKGVQYLAFNVDRLEQGIKKDLPYNDSMKLAKLFNTHISAIVESTLNLRQENLTALMYGSAGCSVDGSWRNKIGEEAENMVKSYIARLCVEGKLIQSLIDINNNSIAYDPTIDYIGTIQNYRGIKLDNRYSILFSSEPDVSFINETGMPISVIEVKGGTDPAGALERLGAIKKSFSFARESNPKAKTILVVSCITREMGRRLEKDPLIDVIFNLTQVIIDMDYREKFLQSLRRILAGKK